MTRSSSATTPSPSVRSTGSSRSGNLTYRAKAATGPVAVSHRNRTLLRHVVGLARSGASAASLKAKGARTQHGDLDDPGSIRAGAENADAVIHLANKHDFTNPALSNRAERDAVEAVGNVLAESHRPF